jgi:hypothetical protein
MTSEKYYCHDGQKIVDRLAEGGYILIIKAEDNRFLAYRLKLS